ncbi:MAG: TfoX/Sxy family protein [Alphaproteobacteria bacterium]|nr:TfoX/Sxy family protein [Pseudomonadota bacterium]
MPPSLEFRDHVLDLLAPLGPVRARRMFGAFGIFLDGRMFGIIEGDALYLKTDEATRGDFEHAGTAPFTYQSRGKTVALTYWEAPSELLEEGDELCSWAQKAIEASLRAKPEAKPRKTRPRQRASAR